MTESSKRYDSRSLARHAVTDDVGRDPGYVLIGASVAIINEWIATRGEIGDVEAWMRANKDNKAWHACAIVKGVEYRYFKAKLWGRHEQCVVPRSEW